MPATLKATTSCYNSSMLTGIIFFFNGQAHNDDESEKRHTVWGSDRLNHQLKPNKWTLIFKLWHADSTALRLFVTIFIGTVCYFWHFAKKKRKKKKLVQLKTLLASINSLKVSICKCCTPVVFIKKSRSENEKPEMANFHLYTPHSMNLKVKGNAYI